MSSPCCPPNSHPSLSDNYTPIGTINSFNSVEFYEVGTLKSQGNAIIIFSDIWGWNSGRVRRFADILSEFVDYILIPKLLSPTIDGGTDDDGLPPGYDLSAHPEVWGWLSQFNYGYMKPKIDEIFTYLNQAGVEKIGLMGVCYGGYLVCHSAIEHPNVVCGVIPHPSIHAEEGLFGGNNAELAKKVHIPLLLLPAGNDPASYLPGGDVSFNSSFLSFKF